jgi:hypothetical protein
MLGISLRFLEICLFQREKIEARSQLTLNALRIITNKREKLQSNLQNCSVLCLFIAPQTTHRTTANSFSLSFVKYPPHEKRIQVKVVHFLLLTAFADYALWPVPFQIYF